MHTSLANLRLMTGSHGKTRRRRLVMAFEMIRLDRTAREPLYQQLYRQIRDELASGNFSGTFLDFLPPESSLPTWEFQGPP